jgi:hypothetical protein
MSIKINMAKALVLLSGGLDSMLAAKVLMEQGIEVTGLSFKSNFFGTAKAKKVAEQLGIRLIEIDFSAEHLAMVKNPDHGYGKNMNPCIDCHAMMLTRAAEYLTPTLSLERRGGIKSPLPPFVKGGSSFQKCKKIPTTSCPWSFNNLAATDESTPPDMATAIFNLLLSLAIY